MFGTIMGIVKFEFKYVEKLHSGERPEHKKFLEALRKVKWMKIMLYCLGIFLMILPILLLMTDTIGTNKDIFYSVYDSKLTFFWGV